MYPETVSPEKCTDCGICKSVCPIMNKPRKSADTKGYAAYCKDEDIRSISSSGGIFSALALDILKEGGAVFGASYDSRFKVMHICVDNEDDLAKLRGAKYAQSYLGSTYLSVKKLLNEGKKVIFSGSPCQVAGLKSFLRKDYENLICIDFVCHGVPSPKVWDKYVEYRANTDNKGKLPKSINLRSKKTGWSRYRYSTEFNYGDKLFSHINTGDIFMLFLGTLLQFLSVIAGVTAARKESVLVHIGENPAVVNADVAQVCLSITSCGPAQCEQKMLRQGFLALHPSCLECRDIQHVL